MSGNYLTPKFWYTGCTILVHRVHRVHHFGTQGAPFWYTGYTGCTILVHRVHHFGTQGAPFWYTGCTILVHRVHHFGTQGAPFWYTGCTITREISFRITSQFPKNEPDPGNTPPDHHGTFEKSPTKTPAGPDGPALITPSTDRPTPATKNHDGDGPHVGRDSHPPGGSEQPPHQQALQPRPNLKHHHAGGHPRQAQISSRGPNRTVLGHPAQTRNRQHKPARLNRQVEMSDPTHRDTRQALHVAAPIRSLLTITLQNILTPSHGHYRPPPFHGPALRAGPNHPSPVL